MVSDKTRRSDDGTIASLPREFKIIRHRSLWSTSRWIVLATAMLLPFILLTYLILDNHQDQSYQIATLEHEIASLNKTVDEKDKIISILKIENNRLTDRIDNLMTELSKGQETCDSIDNKK